MHYLSRKSHWMQKHKFGVTCPGMLLVQIAPGSPEFEKECVNISCPGCTRMQYVAPRSHRMEKLKFGVTCPSTLFVESIPHPPEHEK
jgi:hypothetical protein